MAEEFEYMDVECITIPLEDGTEMECAILDQFEYEGQGYVLLSPVEGEEIQEDMFIYRYEEDGDDIIIDYIDDEKELEAVASFYDQLIGELE